MIRQVVIVPQGAEAVRQLEHSLPRAACVVAAAGAGRTEEAGAAVWQADTWNECANDCILLVEILGLFT